MTIPNRPGIYEIVNTVNGKSYIGSSVTIRHRIRDHFCNLRKNKHRNSHLQNAFNKYGEIAFSFRAILFCDAENLLIYEQACIDGMNPKYNKARKAEAPMQGRRHTEATRKKMSEVAAGRVFSEETRKKMSEAKAGKPNGRSGRHHTEETKRKLRAANSGENSCRFGVSLSEETKRKMSESAKGNQNMLGKHHSEESKRKMSQSHSGTQTWLGKHHTEETKRLISEKKKAFYQAKRESLSGGIE